MYSIEELIEYHNECEFLDFKQEEYNEQNKPHLLKDILAFSNANVEGNRYIIIGVHKKDGQIQLFNIDSKYDSAHIQQYVHANITPELAIEYTPFTHNGFNLMILTIKKPQDQPYMIEKDVFYKSGKICLRANECWIRKGSYQVIASRKDLDRMYESRIKNDEFNGEIVLTFEGTDSTSLNVFGLQKIELPSEKAKIKLEKIIEQKELLQQRDPFQYSLSVKQNWLPFVGTSYEDRSLETLRENLSNISETYLDHDLYYLYEEQSYKLNLDILNVGEVYLEDASIELMIPKINQVFVSDKVYDIDKTPSNLLIPYTPSIPSYETMHYPLVEEIDNYFIVKEDIGNLKHGIKQLAFKVAIRFFIGDVQANTELRLTCKIFGKNLRSTIYKELVICINKTV